MRYMQVSRVKVDSIGSPLDKLPWLVECIFAVRILGIQNGSGCVFWVSEFDMFAWDWDSGYSNCESTSTDNLGNR
jgi:hypothetical protein